MHAGLDRQLGDSSSRMLSLVEGYVKDVGSIVVSVDLRLLLDGEGVEILGVELLIRRLVMYTAAVLVEREFQLANIGLDIR